MVAETHPEEIELFDFVEDDLPQPRRTAIEGHLATCARCADQVRRVQAGRDALHEAQFMHLPERRREGIIANLPTQAPEPGRTRALSPKQLLAILTPIIAIAAVVAVLVNSNPNSTSGSEAAGTTASSASGGGAALDATGGGGERAAFAPFMTSRGPAAEVAGELQRKGFKAAVHEDRVVVTGASKKAVREALADRGPGGVAVALNGR